MAAGTARGRALAEILLTGFLPGALAGTHLAGLLFFLNPHLPFTPGPVTRAVATYAALLGVAGLLLQLPFIWKRPGRARRILPWALTAVLAATALSAWVHASRYAFFLPSGINRRLIKLAILLTVSAAVAFYTTLLHRLRRRRYGPRSFALLTALALLSIYVAFERREAFKQPTIPVPRATRVETGERPRALVVAIESATLDAVLPLAEMGRLPFFARLMKEGAYGRMIPLTPVVRAPLWTTLATGKYPYEHGVVGEALYRAPFAGPNGALTLMPAAMRFDRWGTWSEKRALDSSRVRVQTLWQILTRLGVPTAVVGWPLTAPAPPGVEVVVSERFFAGSMRGRDHQPAELGERARLFRPQRGEVEALELARLDDASQRLEDAAAEDLWRQSLAAFLLDQEPGQQALFVLLPGLRTISADAFGAHTAIHFEGVQQPAIERAAQQLAAYYALLDRWLAALWQSVAPPRLLIVVSAHGVESATGWRDLRRHLTRQSDLSGYVHRGPPGVLMLLGDGVRAGTMLDAAELVDLAPTLLYGLGYPIADDFAGGVITGAFDTTFLARHPLTFVPSYETLARAP